MGRAARIKGKTLEDRIKYALEHKAAEQKRIQELAEQRAMEEVQAWKTMVWWQLELTLERIELVERILSRRRMKAAALHSLLAGTLYNAMGEFIYVKR